MARYGSARGAREQLLVVAQLAAELGHAPTLTLDTYAHVFSEFARGERIDPHQAVAAARDASLAQE